MNVLLIGCGGREHAIALKLSQSKHLGKLYCFGFYINPAISKLCDKYLIGANYREVTELIRYLSIDFAVIGPESVLNSEIVSLLHTCCIACIGPSFSDIETSKYYCKTLMEENNIQKTRWKYFTEHACPEAIK